MKHNTAVVYFWSLSLSMMLMIGPSSGYAQDNRTTSLISIETQFFQLKDEKNYGMVFNGGNILVGYTLQKLTGNNLFSYEAAFGFGAGFSMGIAGINFHLKPVELSYCFPIVLNEKATLYIGPYIAMNYFLQLYPELQSGHALWFTFYDVGPRFVVDTRLKDQIFRIQLANSLIGMVSRPTEMNETYYYSLNFLDLMGNVHSNFKAGSFNLMNHTDFELEWRRIGNSNKSLAYRLEYFHFKKEPRLQYLVHAISFRIKLGGGK
jgi:hypothetical protein